jgi:hypothetical protein
VLDDEVAVVGQLEPRGDAAVVVERRDEDLVAGPQRAAGCAREREVQRGHVGAEDDLVGIAAQEARRPGLGLLEDLLDPQARGVGRAEVGARLAHAARHGLPHLVGHLRAAGSIEEDEVALERGEAPADGAEVAQHRSHAWPFVRRALEALRAHRLTPDLIKSR